MRVETAVPLGNWRSVADAARRAEAVGFDGLESFEIAADPFAPLVLATVATERIRLGTAIAVCFPRSPMVMANIAWDLNVESGGRFTLGLGTQVKGHNERRFSVPWSPPLPRLREYIQAMRAIWHTWETGEKLSFEGEHYNFTLMTPEFSPRPSGMAPPPVTVAAVKPAMMKMVGSVCDGVRLHGFATRKYLEETAMPALTEGMAKSGRQFRDLGRRLHRHRPRRRSRRQGPGGYPLPHRLLRLDAQLPRRARGPRRRRPRDEAPRHVEAGKVGRDGGRDPRRPAP
jgi:alkanesulfonate monooxygenase SsuD/methylene tetrahydromethanopterin reductase-like flavin-dependent oxidoreductase (luciferase family)